MRPLKTLISTLVCGTVFALLAGGNALAQPDPAFVDTGAQVQEMDIREADAFIRHVFEETQFIRYDTATQLYLWLLEQVDQPLAVEEQAILRKHLLMLSMIMPASEQAETGLANALTRERFDALPPGLGARLSLWWRRQDPLPGTTQNERIEEHLTRVAFASHKYQRDDDERGFDDRGEIYIRLGKPSRSKSIELRAAALLTDPLVSKLPENEFWVYKHINYDAHYVFLRKSKKKPYALSHATELIPDNLRNGRRKTPLLLNVMEEVYAQLALEHGYFGKHYDEVADYLTLPPHNARPPHVFAARAIQLALEDDSQHEYTRSQSVPASYTATRNETENLTVPMRWARFLNADGTTRTEFYWSLEPQSLKPSRRHARRLKRQGHAPSEKYLISVAVAQRTAGYHHRALNKKHYLIPVDTRETLPTKTFVVQGDTATYHLAMQWDQQWTRDNNEKPGTLAPGAMLKVGTHAVDSVQALNSQGNRLEMSDLKPLLLGPDDALETAAPYPYERLTPEMPLALYFELYHLAFGSDDQTHYAIEYTIAQKQKGGLLPFQRSRDGQRVGARSSYTGTSRTAREFIMLDLSMWQDKGEIEITLQATDETTGQQITRTIPFVFDP